LLVLENQGPGGLERRLSRFINNMVGNGPVGIWIKIHFNPDAEISIPTSNH